MTNRVTTIVDLAIKEAVANAEKMAQALEEGEGATKALADVLQDAADKAEAELGQMRAASDALADALGADFVAAKAKVGTSVDDIVADLRRMGASYDDIANGAGDLGVAVRRLDALRSSADRAADQVDRVGDEMQQAGRQAKSGSSGLDDFAGKLSRLTVAGVGLQEIARHVVDLVNTFPIAAREADRLAQTMGTNVENASRLQAVLRPLNVELGDTQDVMNNIASKISEGDDAFRELGVTIARTADGVDLNETFIRIIESLAEVEDAADRARLASELFGEEGARQFVPLVANARQLRAELAAVSDTQVITDAELAQAEEYNEAIRDLRILFDEAKTAASQELVPALAAVAQSLIAIDDAIGALIPGNGGGIADVIMQGYESSGLADFVRTIENIQWVFDRFGASEQPESKIDAITDAVLGATPALDRMSSSMATGARNTDLWAGVIQRFGIQVQTLEGNIARAAQARADQDRRMSNLFEVGAVGEGQYRAYLERRLRAYRTYQDEYRVIWQQLRQLDEQEQRRRDEAARAEEDRLRRQTEERERAIEQEARQREAWDRAVANLFATNQFTIDEYRAYLNQRLGAFESYTDDYRRIWEELRRLDDEERRRKDDIAREDERRRKEAADAQKRSEDEARRREEEALNRRTGATDGNLTLNVWNNSADPDAVKRSIESAIARFGPGFLRG